MTNTNVINNANTNVINNANTTVYATVENRNVNDNSQMLMIGEELLCVRKAHDTMYIVNDATQAYVQAYVHQVVGNIACDTVVTQEGNDVHVTLKEVDMMAFVPVLNDVVELVCVDNAEELAMQAEAAYLAYYEGSVNTDVDYLAYYEGGVDIEIDLELGF